MPRRLPEPAYPSEAAVRRVRSNGTIKWQIAHGETPDFVRNHPTIKAMGGIRSLDSMFDVLDVGVTRVGATATKSILDEFKARAAGETPPDPPADLGDDY